MRLKYIHIDVVLSFSIEQQEGEGENLSRLNTFLKICGFPSAANNKGSLF